MALIFHRKNMEYIVNNPGFQHIAETAFKNLNFETLKKCKKVNKSCNEILKNPFFWLEKLVEKGLTVSEKKDWIEAINSNPQKKRAIQLYIKYLIKKNQKNIQSFNKAHQQQRFRKKILINCKKMGNTEIVKVLAPLTENANSCNFPNGEGNSEGNSPLHWATINGYIEIVKILANLADNPITPNNLGRTPIHEAAMYGRSEILQLLVPMTDNPNASDNTGLTPVHLADIYGHQKVVKIIAPYMEFVEYEHVPMSNLEKMIRNGQLVNPESNSVTVTIRTAGKKKKFVFPMPFNSSLLDLKNYLVKIFKNFNPKNFIFTADKYERSRSRLSEGIHRYLKRFPNESDEDYILEPFNHTIFVNCNHKNIVK